LLSRQSQSVQKVVWRRSSMLREEREMTPVKRSFKICWRPNKREPAGTTRHEARRKQVGKGLSCSSYPGLSFAYQDNETLPAPLMNTYQNLKYNEPWIHDTFDQMAVPVRKTPDSSRCFISYLIFILSYLILFHFSYIYIYSVSYRSFSSLTLVYSTAILSSWPSTCATLTLA